MPPPLQASLPGTPQRGGWDIPQRAGRSRTTTAWGTRVVPQLAPLLEAAPAVLRGAAIALCEPATRFLRTVRTAPVQSYVQMSYDVGQKRKLDIGGARCRATRFRGDGVAPAYTMPSRPRMALALSATSGPVSGLDPNRTLALRGARGPLPHQHTGTSRALFPSDTRPRLSLWQFALGGACWRHARIAHQPVVGSPVQRQVL